MTGFEGVIGLTKTAAIDQAGEGTRVNALCPGYCQSSFVNGAAIPLDGGETMRLY